MDTGEPSCPLLIGTRQHPTKYALALYLFWFLASNLPAPIYYFLFISVRRHRESLPTMVTYTTDISIDILGNLNENPNMALLKC